MEQSALHELTAAQTPVEVDGEEYLEEFGQDALINALKNNTELINSLVLSGLLRTKSFVEKYKNKCSSAKQ